MPLLNFVIVCIPDRLDLLNNLPEALLQLKKGGNKTNTTFKVMKKKSIDLKKKLVLGKETLGSLSKKEQGNVAGGAGTVTQRTCPRQHTAFVSCEGA